MLSQSFIDQLPVIFTTAMFTIIGGVIIFVFGEIAKNFFIDPLHDQSKLIGEIASSLTFYANMFGNAEFFDKDEVAKAKDKLRQQASLLRASAWTIRWYWLWFILGFTPKKSALIRASEELIGLSNSMSKSNPQSIEQQTKNVRKFLRLQ